MIATSVFGAITPVAKADVINASVLINKEQLQSGIYTVKNTTKYVEEGNATGEGMARKVWKICFINLNLMVIFINGTCLM